MCVEFVFVMCSFCVRSTFVGVVELIVIVVEFLVNFW